MMMFFIEIKTALWLLEAGMVAELGVIAKEYGISFLRQNVLMDE